MQKLELSVALIRRNDADGTRWLARLAQREHHLKFVVADRLGRETFRESAMREVAWELDLDRHRDFLVSNMAQMNLDFVDHLPGRFSQSRTLVSFYNVEIFRDAVLSQLHEDPQNFWVTSGEICDGVTRQGLAFDPLIPYLVGRSNVIQHWESTPETKG